MVRTTGNPDDRKRGLQIVYTKPLTEKEKEEEDINWSYQHKDEITEEYDKLIKQQKISEYDIQRKKQLHELARDIIKERHGVNI